MLTMESIGGICDHAVYQAKDRILGFDNLSFATIKERLEQALRSSIILRTYYPSHKKEGQYLVYCHFNGRDYWLIVGENKTKCDGDYVVVTIYVHKNKGEWKLLKHQVNAQLSGISPRELPEHLREDRAV